MPIENPTNDAHGSQRFDRANEQGKNMESRTDGSHLNEGEIQKPSGLNADAGWENDTDKGSSEKAENT
jgi:hypothetical protein